MADYYGHQHTHHLHHEQPAPRSYQVVKAATAVTAGGSLLVLSGLTLAGTIIALTVATPLLLIFSPVLVPATITLFFLMFGFLASGGFGVAAISVLSWIWCGAVGVCKGQTGYKGSGDERKSGAVWTTADLRHPIGLRALVHQFALCILFLLISKWSLSVWALGSAAFS